MNKYFAVVCKCGHVGRNNYILIAFPVIANSKKEAARIARSIPRCKHHHKDCIRDVTEVSYENFIKLKHENNRDPYLKCSCIQEQRTIDISSRIISEREACFKVKEESIQSVYSGKIKVKHPKKYFRFWAQQASAVLDFE